MTERRRITVFLRADLVDALAETAHEIPCSRRLLIEHAVEHYLQRLELPTRQTAVDPANQGK